MNIDEIMDMLDWDKPQEIQKKGRELGEKIRCYNVFLQPGHGNYNKNVWDNCAKILSAKTDYELRPYLSKLFEWLMDMNWPGAESIAKRLKEFRDKKWLDYILDDCIVMAKALKEEMWLNNLLEIKETIS